MSERNRYTWDDLTPEVQARVENSQRGVDLIDDGIAVLLQREHIYSDEEREAILKGRTAACAIADRMASVALRTLRTTRIGPTGEIYE